VGFDELDVVNPEGKEVESGKEVEADEVPFSSQNSLSSSDLGQSLKKGVEEYGDRGWGNEHPSSREFNVKL